MVLCLGYPAKNDQTNISRTAFCKGTSSDRIHEHFTGIITMQPGVEFQVRRFALGDTRIELNGSAEKFAILPREGANRISIGGVHELPIIVIAQNSVDSSEEGAGLSLPFVGESIELGALPRTNAFLARPILRTGHINMRSQTVFGKKPFFAGQASLEQGDTFIVDEPSSIFVGVIATDERPLLNVTYNVRAKAGLIRSFFNEDIPVSASILDRLMRDPFLSTISSILAFLLVAYGSISGRRR